MQLHPPLIWKILPGYIRTNVNKMKRKGEGMRMKLEGKERRMGERRERKKKRGVG
jgi:hypothetical protein